MDFHSDKLDIIVCVYLADPYQLYKLRFVSTPMELYGFKNNR